MTTRVAIPTFALANPLYKNASVAFMLVANGAKTSIMAHLFAGPTGVAELPNPQKLNSQGKFTRPVYIEDEVIGVVSGISVPTHDTGIIAISAASEAAITAAAEATASAAAAAAQAALSQSSASASSTDATAADVSANAAAASAAAAAIAALQAVEANFTSTLIVYPTIADGVAATAEGGSFSILQASLLAAYDYTVVGGLARFDRVRLTGTAGMDIALLRFSARSVSLVPAKLNDLLVSGWGTNAEEWDGRVVPNEAAAVPPTLNLLPDPYNPANETGGGTPVRTINDPAVTDPDGGHNAMTTTFSAQNSQCAFINITDDVLPTDNYVIRGRFLLESGGSAFRIGAVAAGATSFAFTADGNWTLQSLTLNAFANTPNLGFSTAVGNSTGVIAAYDVGLFDPFQGGVFPSTTAEKAALGYHAKRPAAYKQSLTFDAFGSLDCTTETDGVLLQGPPDRITPTAFSMGIWILPTSEPTSTSGTAMAFDFHTGGASNISGQLGVTANNATNYDRFGMLYANPNLSFTVLKTGQYLVNEGWQHLSVSVDNGVSTFFINGIPICTQTVPAYVNPNFSKLILASYNGVSRRRKTTQHLPGFLQGWWYRNSAVNQGEATQMDAHGRARIRLSGDTRMGLRKLALFGSGGSITQFAPSYFWHVCQNRNLTPRIHAYCEALGGTGLSDWRADPRKSYFKRQLGAACDAGYDMALALFDAGMNDIDKWDAGTYPFATWLVDFSAHIAELKAINPKVKAGCQTMVPKSSSLYDAAALRQEQLRQNWNDYLRANFVAMGFDYMIDCGLGTERIDIAGNITAETIPGGTVRGNYRWSAGCVAHNVSPAATITFSATSGASFTGTAPAGTFTYQDVGRRIVGTVGDADILAVDATGAVVTLSTTGFAPTPYTNEPAGSVTRDTITRTAFGALSYTSGNWSIRESGGFQDSTAGLHDTQAGGRLLCDVWVSPALATIQAGLAGLG